MAQATSAPTGPAAEPANAKRRGGGLNLILALLLLLQLAGAAGLVALPFLKQAGATPYAGSGPSGATAAVPNPVPALPAMTLAEAAPPAAEGGVSLAGRIPALVGSLGEKLSGLPDGGAPPHLVVRGSGQQPEEKVVPIPPHERWELRFPPGNSVESYARQLEYFHIELGLIGGSTDITYITNLADPTPKTRTGRAADEKRLYLVWQRGSLSDADEQLVSKAKLPIADRVVAHFCPAELEAQLAQREEERAQMDMRTRIRKTVFGVRAHEFGGYRLYVLEQTGD
jgi:hypothetical protein